jgi:molybdopterin-containing oxidoreductase family iron-sulfur binding subunit
MPPAADSAVSAGRRYWRSLEELSETAEFRQMVEREFASQIHVAFDPVNRRKFLTLMGASLALAGVGGCSVKPAPTKEIVPYVRQPEDIIPGKPLFYATAMTLDGAAVGLLVETHLGRPTKIEGNPEHPASRGTTSPLHQAAVLELYDPDRSQTVRERGQARTWADAAAAIRQVVESQRQGRGAGLRLLTEAVVSPTLRRQIETLLRQFPEAKWHIYEAINRDTAYQAARRAFGEPVIPRYDFTQADRVVSLDSDFLVSGPGHLRNAGDFIARRRAPVRAKSGATGRPEGDATGSEMNRLYVVETGVSCTGAKADHRLAIKGREIEPLARQLAAAVGLSLGNAAAGTVAQGDHAAWIAAVAKDLNAHHGTSLVIAGDRQPAAVHLLAYAMNDHLGNVGKTVEYIEPIEARPVDRTQSLRELTDACGRGEVDCLLVLGGNPVLTAPADIPLVAQLEKVRQRIHLGLYEDETARLCHWHLPEAHFLEAWSDTRAHDGTASIVQPMIEPLHGGRSVHEVLGLFTDLREIPGQGIVRDNWQQQWQPEQSAGDFEARWQTALHDGVVAGSRAAAKSVSLASNWQEHLAAGAPSSAASAAAASGAVSAPANAGGKTTGELELVFTPDPSIYDGRFANNGWLQELPKPISKLTWGNAAMMSPATAERLGLGQGKYAHGGEHGGYYMPVVELRTGDRNMTAPLWIMPGHADDTVTVYLGYGREYAGRVGGMPGESVGFNAYPLRSSNALWFAGGVEVVGTGGTELVACTQAHHSMEERAPVRSLSLGEFQKNPAAESGSNKANAAEHGLKLFPPAEHPSANTERQKGIEPPLALYGPFADEPPMHKWGMSIDLTSCIGCNACVVACQAENNIPVVGKDEVSRGREMHWIRVDRYISGSPEAPDEFHFQPLPCMHCENAPCEYVCPVAATVHSPDGLNEMIYNRCVGTRFCSNNCPYKVRRFNFLFYADFESPERRMQYNPDVTVRSRGVMEKCSYCVQRIREGEIGAETQHRKLADGEVLTACQAACPTQAIVFGNMNDPAAKVTHAKSLPLDYSLLEDLNTNPRTTYLAELRNPNPEIG